MSTWTGITLVEFVAAVREHVATPLIVEVAPDDLPLHLWGEYIAEVVQVGDIQVAVCSAHNWPDDDEGSSTQGAPCFFLRQTPV